MRSKIISLILVISIFLTSANFDCRTRVSSRSGTADDSKITVGCTSSYPTMTSCGCKPYSDGKRPDGCWQNNQDDLCYAQNAQYGQGVYAVARCCKFPHSHVSCIGKYGSYVKGDAHASGTLACPSTHKYVTGCSVKSPWTDYDASYPGTKSPVDQNSATNTFYPNENLCTVVNHDGNGRYDGSAAMITCCNSASYDLVCATRYGTAGMASTATCGSDSGYTMTGCSGYGEYKNVKSWEIVYDANQGIDSCAVKSNSAQDVYAIAICCQVESSNPTTSPSNNPTFGPTNNPTFGPSNNPTKSPTNNPTFGPTNNPSTSPSNNPTVTPTKTPTSNPSDAPSDQPTISPTNNPSSSPTFNILYESENYVGVAKLLNTNDANGFCQIEFGSGLATVLDENDQIEIETNVLKQMYENTSRHVVHFGYRNKHGIAKWVHGNCVAKSTFDAAWHTTGSPPHANQCGFFNLFWLSHWDIGTCLLRRYFICNNPNGKYATPIC